MKKYTLLIFLFIISSLLSSGQKQKKWRYYWWEGELGGGMNISFTDLSKWKISPVGTVSLRYKFYPFLAVKLQVPVGQSTATKTIDSLTVYSSTSLWVAPSFRLEYEIYRSKRDLPGYNTRGLDMDLRRYWVYGFAGIGGIYSDPLPGDDLAKGDYNKYTWIVPIGAGIKYNFNRILSVGAEIEFNFTGSDYLEGYSPGHSSKNDKFMLFRAQAAYRFGTTSSSSLQKR